MKLEIIDFRKRDFVIFNQKSIAWKDFDILLIGRSFYGTSQKKKERSGNFTEKFQLHEFLLTEKLGKQFAKFKKDFPLRLITN